MIQWFLLIPNLANLTDKISRDPNSHSNLILREICEIFHNPRRYTYLELRYETRQLFVHFPCSLKSHVSFALKTRLVSKYSVSFFCKFKYLFHCFLRALNILSPNRLLVQLRCEECQTIKVLK